MHTEYVQQYGDLWRRHWWWRARHALVKRVASEVLSRRCGNSKPARILDIGCGGGLAFDDWSKLGDVEGVEPDPHLAASLPRWRDRVEARPFGADYQCDARYDLIFMLDVLEHIEDDLGAAQSLRRLLTPGGAIVLTVPALPSLWSVHDEVNLHFRRYTDQTLSDTLQSAGLRVERLEYFFAWSLGLLRLRRWWTRGKQPANYQVRVPPAPINCAFRWLSLAEQKICRTLGSPAWGSSLLAVAQLDTSAPPPSSEVSANTSQPERTIELTRVRD